MLTPPSEALNIVIDLYDYDNETMYFKPVFAMKIQYFSIIRKMNFVYIWFYCIEIDGKYITD